MWVCACVCIYERKEGGRGGEKREAKGGKWRGRGREGGKSGGSRETRKGKLKLDSN